MKSFFPFCFLLILLASCAKMVTPVGGPRDSTPPSVVKEIPLNKSTLFKDKQIAISFDEFFLLQNPNKNIIFSPPLNHTPTYTINRKSLIIKFNDTLQPNTTYNIGFSNCIKDFTEGNLIPFYNYTFSTGTIIDSFSISGKLINAQTLEPIENCFIFLYKNNIDSLPLTQRPDYLTKSQKKGLFAIDNISQGNYKIFALQDINNNFLFDLPNEEIAFLNEPVSTVKMMAKDTSSLKNSDSLLLQFDSLAHHSLILKLFTQVDTQQKLLKFSNPAPGYFQFPYKTPFSSFSAQRLNGDSIPYFQLISPSLDTVIWFFKEPVRDSLAFLFTVDNKLTDTVFLAPFKKTTSRVRGSKPNEINKLSVSFSNKGELYKPLILHFSYPIKPVEKFETILISKLKNKNDTLISSFSIPDTFVKDFPLSLPITEKASYTLIISDSVFMGYNQTSNDSIFLNFTTKSEKDYGSLSMKYLLPQQGIPYIILLKSEQNEIIQKNVITESASIYYPFLNPGNYSIMVIEDKNRNGKWDTGNYHQGIQPEMIYSFEKTITIRGFWDLEEQMKIEK